MTVFIYGKHAALAAIANPMRKIKRVLVTKAAASTLALPLEGEG